jgi:AcrR family transcriptional regulator
MRKPIPHEPSEGRHRPGPEPRFSRDELARRALAIMDVRGPTGLTMRALAAELGMGTMALYRYFPSKRELMDAAIEIAAPEIELPSSDADDWKDQLARLARGMFQAGLRHPSLARERFERPLTNPGAMRVTDAAIALLLQAGVSKGDAVAAFKALLILTLGAATAAASESRSEVRRRASARHATASPGELPALASVADELTAALGGDQAFEFGMAALLDGIERRAQQRR